MGYQTCGQCSGSGKIANGYASCNGCSGAGWKGQGLDGGTGVCSWCGGSGKSNKQIMYSCSTCGGLGKITIADDKKDSSHAVNTGEQCFVATTVYSDSNHPNVCALRKYRDLHLLQYKSGYILIRMYYLVGSFLSKVIGNSEILRKGTRMVLDKLVSYLVR